MYIKYNREKIKEIIEDLSLLTGISISFLDNEYNTVCSCTNNLDFCSIYQSCDKNRKVCQLSDTKLLERCKSSGKYEFHICPAGLYDAAMPIIKSGITVGHIIMGRIRYTNSPKPQSISGNPLLSELYDKITLFSEEQLISLKNLLPNILFSNAITFEKNSFTEISAFIEKNLSMALNTELICNRFYISKNKLYKCFKKNCGYTVNEYIIMLRLNRATELLKNTSEPIYRICEAVGINNYTYFSRIFKKKIGTTPYEYRKSF